MKVIVTGGCGYKGNMLVPALVRDGHEVFIIDAGWFGGAPDMRADIRSIGGLPMADAIIHLAGIANDPCGELDAKLTWEVNVLATMRLAEYAVRVGIRQFIFASSASVYGLKGNAAVVETDSLEPVSDYNKTKMVAERVLMSYSDRMAVQIVRPATVCGYSTRMRLDTMVNMLTIQALTKGEITAHCGEHGGSLMRPNIHIDDVVRVYCWMLAHPELTGAYNAGFENISALDTAQLIADEIPAKVTITKVKDKRSYAVNSSKLLDTGFKPLSTVRDAITDICVQYAAGQIRDDDSAYNLRWMKQNGLVAA